MTSLVRTLLMLRSENGDKPYLTARSQGVPPPTFADEPLTGSLRAGFIAIGAVALCSWIATFSLISFLTYRFIFWQRYYKRPLAHNQYVVLIYNLLLVDIQQATAFLLCLHWVARGGVNYPSAACVLQGWWIQTADPGSGLFVLAIAIHTCAVVLRGRQLPFTTFVWCVVGLWAFIILLGLIAVGLYGSKTFVISEAGWCWLSPQAQDERLWGHYLWIFLSEFGTIILYGIMFVYLRRQMKQAAALRQNHQESLNRLNRVVVYMVIYPLVYVLLSLPLAAGRMSTARHVVPSKEYFAAAGALMALSGLVDVIVYTLTRRHLLLDTEVSTSDRYYAHTGSNLYNTHVSTTVAGPESKKSRVKSRLRRGLQSINDTVLDDRGDSTEDIVPKGQKGDMELGNLAHGVYQETTIEITHEAAEPEEPLRKPNRFSR
ncbi:protein gprD [Aspergillus novofumigatus IBT 16806]|uniref:G protein-coupled receptor GPR1/2/3 C-terminal domain-containing protein n=1 Tax=Aspergillus novofumigatus (strain IBT 16806) TaxID=1392255 RepID=A0A2I1CN54_ASPN1|nr:uncharacterized protein P174DRAFT_456628 [Aspergillus novofumigatus IBT 16806]PKX99061.1 hypothetical protein P174DRAFT_456628 [Aspergillus novofumigatus IBT 16806]